MQAILNGNLNFVVVLIFPALLICGFIMKRVVFGIRAELDLAEYEMERGPIEEAPKPPSKEDALPGYIWLTREDYDEIVEKLRREFIAVAHESGAAR